MSWKHLRTGETRRRRGSLSIAGKHVVVAAVAASLAVGTVAVSMSSASATASSVSSLTDGVNGIVYASTHVGDRTIIGGDFSWAGPPTANGVPVDGTTGAYTSLPRINGAVSTSIRDGSGGWYVGGSFEFAGGFLRNGAARVSSSGVVSAWDPRPNGVVKAMAMSGSVVYLAGSFTSMGGQARGGLAAVDRVTGALLSWNPGVNGTVSSLAVSADGTTIYIGGAFSGLGGQGRANLGAVGSNGATTAWAPSVDGPVNALAVQGSTVYAGGAFTSAGGAARSNLAALDATGAALPLNADTDGPVNALAVTTAALYVGGQFSTLGGQAHANVGAIDTATGTPAAFSPSVNGSVNSLTVNSTATTVYAAWDLHRSIRPASPPDSGLLVGRRPDRLEPTGRGNGHHGRSVRRHGHGRWRLHHAERLPAQQRRSHPGRRHSRPDLEPLAERHRVRPRHLDGLHQSVPGRRLHHGRLVRPNLPGISRRHHRRDGSELDQGRQRHRQGTGRLT